jgi:hypothetical protein
MNEITFFKALLLTSIWAGLVILDYYLTARGQRDYLRNAKEILIYEAGYRLEDPSQDDLDTKPIFTLRSILTIISSSLALMITWLFVVEFWGNPGIFSFFLGGLFLTIIAVDMRHIQNIYLYLNTGTPNGITGKLIYPGWIGYRSSALEMFTFSGLFLTIAIILPSWFLAGGSFGCAVIGVRHWIWSNRRNQRVKLQE